jgi:hypothetical protein
MQRGRAAPRQPRTVTGIRQVGQRPSGGREPRGPLGLQASTGNETRPVLQRLSVRVQRCPGRLWRPRLACAAIAAARGPCRNMYISLGMCQCDWRTPPPLRGGMDLSLAVIFRSTSLCSLRYPGTAKGRPHCDIRHGGTGRSRSNCTPFTTGTARLGMRCRLAASSAPALRQLRRELLKPGAELVRSALS